MQDHGARRHFVVASDDTSAVAPTPSGVSDDDADEPPVCSCRCTSHCAATRRRAIFPTTWRSVFYACLTEGPIVVFHRLALQRGLRGRGAAITPTRCIAFQLLEAYAAYKDVTLLGKSIRHEWVDPQRSVIAGPVAAGAGAGGSEYHVTKRDRNGARSLRVLRIRQDGPAHYRIYNYDGAFLKKRFLLSQIVQVRNSQCSPCIVAIPCIACYAVWNNTRMFLAARGVRSATVSRLCLH